MGARRASFCLQGLATIAMSHATNATLARLQIVLRVCPLGVFSRTTLAIASMVTPRHPLFPIIVL